MISRSQDVVYLVARILLSLLFLIAGYGKLTGFTGFAERMGGMGFPLPSLVAILTVVLEIGGALALILGFRLRIAAVALALFCIASALVGHVGPGELNNFLKNVGLAGGFLLLAVSGPGRLSWDARVRNRA